MRKLKVIEHMSLDGVIQHSADDGDFPYGGWIAPYRTPAGLDAVLAAQGERFDLLLGRRTYDIWSVAWGPAEGLEPDDVAGVRRVKAQDGPDLVLWGSSTLTSTVLEHGLADEVLLLVYPVLLGTGKRLFVDGTPARALELASTRALPSGIIMSTYTVAGPVKTE